MVAIGAKESLLWSDFEGNLPVVLYCTGTCTTDTGQPSGKNQGKGDPNVPLKNYTRYVESMTVCISQLKNKKNSSSSWQHGEIKRFCSNILCLGFASFIIGTMARHSQETCLQLLSAVHSVNVQKSSCADAHLFERTPVSEQLVHCAIKR